MWRKPIRHRVKVETTCLWARCHVTCWGSAATCRLHLYTPVHNFFFFHWCLQITFPHGLLYSHRCGGCGGDCEENIIRGSLSQYLFIFLLETRRFRNATTKLNCNNRVDQSTIHHRHALRQQSHLPLGMSATVTSCGHQRERHDVSWEEHWQFCWRSRLTFLLRRLARSTDDVTRRGR